MLDKNENIAPKHTGYVYLWFDKKRKMFYVGSHYGQVTDNYVCSNKWMKDAHKKRPGDFKMRVVEYRDGDLMDLQSREQHYLNMIDDSELSTSKNVMEGRNRYYNMKKTARGGSQKGHTKNRNKPAWNKGLTKETDSRVKKYGEGVSKAKFGVKFTDSHKRNLSLALGGNGVRPTVTSSIRVFHMWVIKTPSGVIEETPHIRKYEIANNQSKSGIESTLKSNKPNRDGYQVIKKIPYTKRK